MGKTVYFECNAGISGDMTVAALLDLGANQAKLQDALASISDLGFETKISRVKKGSVDCMDFDVILQEIDNHDHDMEYLHGHDQQHHHEAEYHHDHEHHHMDEHHHDHEHYHMDEHHHDHEHHHEDEHHHDHEHHHVDEHHHHHAHRGMQEVIEIIDRCEMTENAKSLAKKIFTILAMSEAKAHGVPMDQVHFHEVGAVDSIVDILAVSILVDDLEIDRVILEKVCEGTGTVRCQHGILPIPVPAVANIIADCQLSVQIMNVKGEFVTPTGAAILGALVTSNKLPASFQIKRIGMGAGKRNYERPSILRLMWIEENENEQVTEAKAASISNQDCGCGSTENQALGNVIYKLESNIDDCTGEALGYTMDCLLQAGARDVHYFPVYMKKNRPGYQLNVICDKHMLTVMQDIIFKHTTTIGIRILEMGRITLTREIKEIDTPLGKAKVKICQNGEETYIYPEYESVAKLAKESNQSFQDVYDIVKSAYAR